MSESFTGLITKVRKDRKGFFIDGNWYSVFASSEMDGVNKGDTVTFTFTKKGDWNNIDNGTVKVTAASAPAPSGSTGGSGGGSYNSQFRSVPELNRIDGLRFAVETIGSTTIAGDMKEAAQATLKLAAVYTAFIEGSLGGAAPAPAPAANNAPDADAKAAAAKAEEERKEAEAKATAEAAAKQQAAGASALDDFLGG
jgi:hypothetical protein